MNRHELCRFFVNDRLHRLHEQSNRFDNPCPMLTCSISQKAARPACCRALCILRFLLVKERKGFRYQGLLTNPVACNSHDFFLTTQASIAIPRRRSAAILFRCSFAWRPSLAATPAAQFRFRPFINTGSGIQQNKVPARKTTRHHSVRLMVRALGPLPAAMPGRRS